MVALSTGRVVRIAAYVWANLSLVCNSPEVGLTASRPLPTMRRVDAS